MLGTFVECESCHGLVEDAPICPTCGHEPMVPPSLCRCGQPGCGGQPFLATDAQVEFETVGEHVFAAGASRCDNCGAGLDSAFLTPCGPR